MTTDLDDLPALEPSTAASSLQTQLPFPSLTSGLAPVPQITAPVNFTLGQHVPAPLLTNLDPELIGVAVGLTPAPPSQAVSARQFGQQHTEHASAALQPAIHTRTHSLTHSQPSYSASISAEQNSHGRSVAAVPSLSSVPASVSSSSSKGLDGFGSGPVTPKHEQAFARFQKGCVCCFVARSFSNLMCVAGLG